MSGPSSGPATAAPRARRGSTAGAEDGVGARERGQAAYRILDMDCPDCARRIQDRLRRLDGIEEAVGNPVSRRLRVAFDPARLDEDRIRAEIGRLGYLARPDGTGAADEDLPRTWTGPDAYRTYGAAALFLAGLLVAWLAPGGALLALPLHDLHVADLLFVLAAGLGGWNFFPAGLRAARAASLDMNFLMTVAIVGAVAVGQFLEAGAIAFLFSLAELLETYSVDRARDSLRSLLELSPDRASVIREGREVTVPADEVGVGETVVVRPGDRIPVDGTVLEGASSVDQATITGESMPVEKERGHEVYAGTINGDGYLRVRTGKAAGDSTLARIIHLVEEAEGLKAPSERFVDRFARYYTPAVTAAAVLLAAIPPLLFGASFETWFVRGLTLLVIACPCALVISTPVAVVSGITAAARRGVLIKGGVHLEALGQVEVFAMDKTGTVTAGHPEVTDVVPLDGEGEDELLALAAAVEAHSQHPVARAVVREARHRGLDPERWRVEGFEDVQGKGVRARLDGREIRVGLPALFSDDGAVEERIDRLRDQGKTSVVVGRPERPMGLIAVADRPREEAAEALRRLRAAGVGRIVMLTGDNRATAEAIGEELGFDEVCADLLPHEKVAKVRELEERYGPVAMVGDGVNDGPALAAATVGIAMGVAGSDAALETADVALMGDELGRLPYVFDLSRRGRGVIRQNIGASLGLKFLLAAGVPLGWVSLVVAVLVGDMGASLGVTGNSLRLARVSASA